MSSTRSIEARLTAWFTSMLFAGYLVFALVLWIAIDYGITKAVDDTLSERIERIAATVENDADGPEEVAEDLVELILAAPDGELARIRDGDGRRLYPRGESASSFRAAESGPNAYRAVSRDVTILGERYEILLVGSLESLDRVASHMLTTLAIAAPVALALSVLGGFAIARRALRPVDAISDAAAKVTVQNLGQRLPVPDTGDALERLSRTFNQMLERLEESVQRIEQFTGDASHELRTPVSVIQTTAELALRHGRDPADYRRDLEGIHAEATSLGELVDVLLALSRAGFGDDDVQLTPIDLAAVAESVCERFRRAAEQKGLGLDFKSRDAPLLLKGNEAALRTLIAALLTNGVEHTTSGAVRVGVSGENRTVTLEVRDSGEGIAEADLPYIFDRFYRADTARARTDKSANFGLGLAIARRIAVLHHATIAVESRPGEGSSFTVTFPRLGGNNEKT